jgi:hypothetical protein
VIQQQTSKIPTRRGIGIGIPATWPTKNRNTTIKTAIRLENMVMRAMEMEDKASCGLKED